MPFTYILYSDSFNKYYVGATSLEVHQRLKYHLSHHKGFTAKAKDWKVIFQFESESIQQALALEKKIKKRGAKRFLESL